MKLTKKQKNEEKERLIFVLKICHNSMLQALKEGNPILAETYWAYVQNLHQLDRLNFS